MNKNLLLAFSLFVSTEVINAKPVQVSLAQTVASNFYTQNTNTAISNLTLAYTAKSANADALYYVFNVNLNSGFVIVSADDAMRPIMGYSTEGTYVAPTAGNNLYYWMQDICQSYKLP